MEAALGEALHALGLRTSRVLWVVYTGEQLPRRVAKGGDGSGQGTEGAGSGESKGEGKGEGEG